MLSSTDLRIIFLQSIIPFPCMINTYRKPTMQQSIFASAYFKFLSLWWLLKLILFGKNETYVYFGRASGRSHYFYSRRIWTCFWKSGSSLIALFEMEGSYYCIVHGLIVMFCSVFIFVRLGWPNSFVLLCVYFRKTRLFVLRVWVCLSR